MNQAQVDALNETWAAHADTLQPFRSHAEVSAAMSDARYKSDHVYRAEVAARLQKAGPLL
jgi:hypothetical protein